MKNAFDYLEYWFFTLFSKRFLRIVGSSIFVDIFVSIVSAIILFTSLKYIWIKILENGVDNTMMLILQSLIILLWVMTIGIVTFGWKLIIIPLRSIENADKKMNLDEDFSLFSKYFPYFLSYITWYSLLLFLWIIFSLWWWIIFWMKEHYLLLFIFECIMLSLLIVAQTGLALAWYNTLLNPTYWLKSFSESLQLTNWKKWTIFKTIFLYSFVLSIATGVLSSMSSIFPTPDIRGKVDNIKQTTLSWEKMSIATGKDIFEETYPMIVNFLPYFSVFFILFRIESILSVAMMQIFLMRLTLDIRAKE